MPSARHRKTKSASSENIKSVFYFGHPNKGKRDTLVSIQKAFLDTANRYIDILQSNRELLLPILKNDKKDSSLRALEKKLRPKGLNSAFSQNAFDCAVTHLSNRLDSIRIEMLKCAYDDKEPTLWYKSKVLFCMMSNHADIEEMQDAIGVILAATKKDKAFYRGLLDELGQMSAAAFLWQRSYFDVLLSQCSAEFKVPVLTHELVPLDSRLMRLEKSDSTRCAYVISVTNPFVKGQRIEVPVTNSRRGLRRLKQYKAADSVSFSVEPGGVLRIQQAVTRKNTLPEPSKAVGVDTGMNDCLHTSSDTAIGTMNDVIDYYKAEVEPSFGGLSDMRNKKRSISHYLHTHKSVPASVRRSLVNKMDRLEQQIREAEAPYRKKRRYRQMLDKEIKDTVMSYVDSIDRDTMTILELLDVKEFNKSRALNGRLSVFARGLLHQKLMETLSWKGYQYTEVPPEFTSQVCPRCSHLDKDSRNGKRFACTCCGYTDDADHVGALNILERFQNKELFSLCKLHEYAPKRRSEALINYYAEMHNLFYEDEASETLITDFSSQEAKSR